MATTAISLGKPTIMTQQIQTQIEYKELEDYSNNPEFEKYFPRLTLEQLEQQLEEAHRSAIEGRTTDAFEFLRGLREKYGV